ncbi:MAG: PEGA domain-containing protein [candidate division KSB1 bacterium]|nr:PEGA domain-containing protein [candidate division KSB1 bacterium]MDZ7335349.1 PEGA domain-containing protein [candidate division KSB1 bacterium]MDZ7399035.1 PEGA domain-containing protein [candidate division KSB1 bacterium]
MFFRHSLSTFISLLICWCFITLDQPVAKCQPADSLGFLNIQTDSLHVEIFLNNKTLGFTPLPILALPAGKYQITASHPNPYIWGNLDWRDSILVVAHDTLIVRPKFKTILTIRTNPFDAAIYLDNELIGHTPLSFPIDLSPDKQLVIKKEGFHDQLVRLSDLKNNSIQIDLIRNQYNWELSQTKYRHQKLIKKYYRSISYSLWGLSIVTGLSTVYFKDQADDYYQKYLVAGSMQQMNRYYSATRRYDRYTYISLAALQACFGLSFYFLMKSLD